jgi:hypothetical protein
MACAWPDTNAETVPLLSSKRLMSEPRELLVLDGAARHRDALAREIGEALHAHALGGEHCLEEWRIGRGEVDDLLALRVLAEGGDDQVRLARLQVRDAVGAGDRRQFHGDAQLAGDVVRHVDVQALRLQVRADEAVRREIGRDRDRDLLALHDVVQRGLRLRAAGREHGEEGQAQREVAFARCHKRAPR